MQGGAVFIYYGTVTFTECTLTQNTAVSRSAPSVARRSPRAPTLPLTLARLRFIGRRALLSRWHAGALVNQDVSRSVPSDARRSPRATTLPLTLTSTLTHPRLSRQPFRFLHAANGPAARAQKLRHKFENWYQPTAINFITRAQPVRSSSSGVLKVTKKKLG